MASLASRVARLGPAGSFGDVAATWFFSPSYAAQYGVFADSNQDVVAAIVDGRAEQGIVPIENSVAGQVGESIDALTHTWQAGAPVYATGTLVLPVEHCFIGVDSQQKLGNVTRVLTHPQAYQQCQQQINQQIGEHIFVPTSSTAMAVEQVVDNATRDEWHAVAIGHRRAALVYGGQILATGIQDDSANRTRFLLLSEEPGPPPSGNDTTLVVFSCPDKAGALFRVLKAITRYSLNMGMIASRPIDLGQYSFCITFQGHQEHPGVENAINQMRQACDWMHVIGSYPAVWPDIQPAG